MTVQFIMNFLVIVVPKALITRGITTAHIHYGECALQHLLKYFSILCRYTPHMPSSTSHCIVENHSINHQTAHFSPEQTPLDVRALNPQFS